MAHRWLPACPDHVPKADGALADSANAVLTHVRIGMDVHGRRPTGLPVVHLGWEPRRRREPSYGSEGWEFESLRVRQQHGRSGTCFGPAIFRSTCAISLKSSPIVAPLSTSIIAPPASDEQSADCLRCPRRVSAEAWRSRVLAGIPGSSLSTRRKVCSQRKPRRWVGTTSQGRPPKVWDGDGADGGGQGPGSGSASPVGLSSVPGRCHGGALWVGSSAMACSGVSVGCVWSWARAQRR